MEKILYYKAGVYIYAALVIMMVLTINLINLETFINFTQLIARVLP